MNLTEIIEAAKKATPGPWKWWTSNSWKRLSTEDRDGGVICPVVSRADGNPDLSIKEHDMRHIANCTPERIIALCEFVQAFDEWIDLADDGRHSEALKAYRRMMFCRRKLDD